MRMLLIAAVTAPLSMCAPDIPVSTQIDQTISQVQGIAVSICRFEPTAATVAKLIAAFTGAGPLVDTATAIAEGICNTVGKTGARRGARAPKLHGVTIRGRFVRVNQV